MNRHLNIAIRVITLVVVASPFFAWIFLHASMTYPPKTACAADDTDCQIEAIDVHMTP